MRVDGGVVHGVASQNPSVCRDSVAAAVAQTAGAELGRVATRGGPQAERGEHRAGLRLAGLEDAHVTDVVAGASERLAPRVLRTP